MSDKLLLHFDAYPDQEDDVIRNVDFFRDADDGRHMGHIDRNDDGSWTAVCFDPIVGFDSFSDERGKYGWNDWNGTLEECKLFLEMRCRYPDLFFALESSKWSQLLNTAPMWVAVEVLTKFHQAFDMRDAPERRSTKSYRTFFSEGIRYAEAAVSHFRAAVAQYEISGVTPGATEKSVEYFKVGCDCAMNAAKLADEWKEAYD
jgi:hypothetical protein